MPCPQRVTLIWIWGPQFAFVIHPHVYLRWGRVYAPDRTPPETRLKLAIWASILLIVSFLWSGYVTGPLHPDETTLTVDIIEEHSPRASVPGSRLWAA